MGKWGSTLERPRPRTGQASQDDRRAAVEAKVKAVLAEQAATEARADVSKVSVTSIYKRKKERPWTGKKVRK